MSELANNQEGLNRSDKKILLGSALAALAFAGGTYLQARMYYDAADHYETVTAPQTVDAMGKDGLTIAKAAYSDELAFRTGITDANGRDLTVTVDLGDCTLPLRAKIDSDEQGNIVDIHDYALAVVQQPRLAIDYTRRGIITDKYEYYQGQPGVIEFEDLQGLADKLQVADPCDAFGIDIAPNTTIAR